jgi:hypothetical protein
MEKVKGRSKPGWIGQELRSICAQIELLVFSEPAGKPEDEIRKLQQQRGIER